MGRPTTTCGSDYDSYGNFRFTHPDAAIVRYVLNAAAYNSDVNWGFSNFDNIAVAALTIFQCIAREGWSDAMYMLQDAGYGLSAVCYFVSFIIVGSFFMLNLTLAVIWENSSDASFIEAEEKKLFVDAENKKKLKENAIDLAAGLIVPPVGVSESKLSAVRVFFAGVAHHWIFNVVRTGLMLLNTIILSLDKYPIDDELDEIVEMISFRLTLAFLLEVVLKVLGHRWELWAKDRYNLFDAFVVVLGITEVAVSPPQMLAGGRLAGRSKAASFSGLRSVRLFALFKLARSWPSLQKLLSTMLSTLKEVGNFSVLFLLFMYIYALIGMQTFANQFRFDEHGYPVDSKHEVAYIPRSNFDTLLWSMVTVFQHNVRRSILDPTSPENVILLPGIIAEGRKLRGTFCAEWLPYMTSTADGWLLDSNGSPYKLAHSQLSVGTAQLGDILRWEWIRPGVLNFIPTCGISGFSRPSIRAQTNVLRLYNGQRHYNHEWHLHTSEATRTHVDTTLVKATHIVHSAMDCDVMATRDLNGQKVSFHAHPRFTRIVQLWGGNGRYNTTRSFYRQQVAATRTQIGKDTRDAAVNKAVHTAGSLWPGLQLIQWSELHNIPGITAYTAQTLLRLKANRLSMWNYEKADQSCSNPECSQVVQSSVQHLFWECPKAKLVWNYFYALWAKIGITPSHDPAIWIFSLDLPDTPRHAWTTIKRHIIGHKFSNEHLQDHLYPVAHTLWRYMSASLIHAIWCAHLRRMDSDPIESTAEMAIMMTRLEAGMRNLTRLAEAQAGDSDGHTVAAVLKAYVDCFLSQTDAIPLTPSDTRGVYLLFFDGGSRGNPGPGGTGSIITSRRLADCIDIRGWYHHYRAFNKMADSAANLAMDTRTSTQVHFPTQRAAFNNLTQDLNDVMHWLMRSSEDPRRRASYSTSCPRAPHGLHGEKSTGRKCVSIEGFPRPIVFINANVSSVRKDVPSKLTGRSLLIFTLENPIRKASTLIITHPHFDDVSLVLIAVSTVALAIDNPLNPPDSAFVCILSWLDSILAGLFMFEVAVKIIALGFFMDENAYLRSGWNLMDFVITTLAAFSLSEGRCQAFFEVTTTEGWVTIMLAGVDATEIDMQPIPNYREGWTLFFIAFILVGKFFVVQLFVGVVIENFNKMKEKLDGTYLLSNTQREWLIINDSMLNLRPVRKMKAPQDKTRRVLFHLARNHNLEIVVMGFSNRVLELRFHIHFIMEAAVKITGLGRYYWKDSWNIFNFVIVSGSLLGMLYTRIGGSSVGTAAGAVRSFRTGRLFRLVQSAPSLRQLFNTLLITLSSLVNIGGLLFLIFFIYAAMGVVQLFAKVEFGDLVTPTANFQTIARAMVTLHAHCRFAVLLERYGVIVSVAMFAMKLVSALFFSIIIKKNKFSTMEARVHSFLFRMELNERKDLIAVMAVQATFRFSKSYKQSLFWHQQDQSRLYFRSLSARLPNEVKKKLYVSRFQASLKDIMEYNTDGDLLNTFTKHVEAITAALGISYVRMVSLKKVYYRKSRVLEDRRRRAQQAASHAIMSLPTAAEGCEGAVQNLPGNRKRILQRCIGHRLACQPHANSANFAELAALANEFANEV
ncbi:Voltage-gated ion channel, partial [Globisporangium splendens]